MIKIKHNLYLRKFIFVLSKPRKVIHSSGKHVIMHSFKNFARENKANNIFIHNIIINDDREQKFFYITVHIVYKGQSKCTKCRSSKIVNRVFVKVVINNIEH